MVEEKSASPEKQLLELIEKPAAKSSIQATAIKYQGLSLFSLGALKGRLSFFKNRFKGLLKPSGIQQLDIKAVNLALRFFVFILVLYFVFHLSLSLMNMRKELEFKIELDKAGEIRTSQIASFLKSASYYLEKARGRDIFRMGVKPVLTGGASKGPSSRIIEATQHFKLVGISWSDDPDVMIEDTKNQRTLFLKKGNMVDSAVKLEAVFKDKVILSYAGEEVELK